MLEDQFLRIADPVVTHPWKDLFFHCFPLIFNEKIKINRLFHFNQNKMIEKNIFIVFNYFKKA